MCVLHRERKERKTHPHSQRNDEQFAANSYSSFWKPSDVSKLLRSPPAPARAGPQSGPSQCPVLTHYTASLRCEVGLCPMARCSECAVSTCGLTGLSQACKVKPDIRCQDAQAVYCPWAFKTLAGDKLALSSAGTGMFPQQVVRTLVLAGRALEA